MSIYRFKITPRDKEDTYRIIDVLGVQNFEVFHKCIIRSFKFEEGELASFYLNYGSPDSIDICLAEMQKEKESSCMMKDVRVREIVSEENNLLTYVYDFISFWAFEVKLEKIIPETTPNIKYPCIIEETGSAPSLEDQETGMELNSNDAELIKELMDKNKGIFDDEMKGGFDEDDEDDENFEFNEDNFY